MSGLITATTDSHNPLGTTAATVLKSDLLLFHGVHILKIVVNDHHPCKRKRTL